jgi:nucleotide-binding universal stress UspA family protein
MTERSRRAADPAYRNILVPLDGSKLAAGALATADALAKRFGATVHTVGIAGRLAGAEGMDVEVTDLRDHAASALGTDPDDPRVDVRADRDVAGAIHRRAEELGSCLVCMSTHGRGRLAGAVVGSVARDVVERCREPVVAVGPSAARPDPEDETVAPPLEVHHLVACVDGTAMSELVVPVAAAWADTLGMRLTLVTVAEPSPAPTRIGAEWRRHHGPDTDADEYTRALEERWGGTAPGLGAEVVYDPISPAEGMRTYLAAHPAGLIAVASHLRAGFERVVFGAAAADIVRVSTAPALIVPLMELRDS